MYDSSQNVAFENGLLLKCHSKSYPSSQIDLTKDTHFKRSASLQNLQYAKIKFEEIAPANSTLLINTENQWKMSLGIFSSKKNSTDLNDKSLSKSIRKYYQTQDELIQAYEDLLQNSYDQKKAEEYDLQIKEISVLLAKVSFAVNVLLLIVKIVATVLSGSLSILSAVIDSAMDLISGLLMWLSNRAMTKNNIYEYPQGRTRLEPISIVILSVIMALTSFQVMIEAIRKCEAYSKDDSVGPIMKLPTIIIISITIATKLILFLICRRYSSNTCKALAQDHRNDVISNTGAVICAFIGSKYWKFADPIGAFVISIYIIISWIMTGTEQIKFLTGYTANPDFLKKITWIAINHDPRILFIDTVRAFHFGNNFLVEVDIVLPKTIILLEAHDIGESLQIKIEQLKEVERAFVHLDYEFQHHPSSEHKVV